MPRLFSYGSLQQPEVQQATFGRRLQGRRDELREFQMHTVAHGDKTLANIRRDRNGVVAGTVFDVSDQELMAADLYERSDGYVRQTVTLASGVEAWVFVDAATID